jgi:hypothetical protein
MNYQSNGGIYCQLSGFELNLSSTQIAETSWKFGTPVGAVDHIISPMAVFIVIYPALGLHPLIRTHILYELVLIYPRRLFGAITVKCHSYYMMMRIFIVRVSN